MNGAVIHITMACLVTAASMASIANQFTDQIYLQLHVSLRDYIFFCMGDVSRALVFRAPDWRHGC